PEPPLEPHRLARSGGGGGLQGRLGAESAPVAGDPRPGLEAEREGAIRPGLLPLSGRVDARQPARPRDQLGEQPRGGAPHRLLVLGESAGPPSSSARSRGRSSRTGSTSNKRPAISATRSRSTFIS